MSNPEMRYMQGASCELRSLDEQESSPKIIGTGVVFNSRSELLGGMFREVIKSTAFDHCDMNDVRGLFNHDPNYILGRTTNHTLTLIRNSNGLDYEITPPTNPTIRDLVLDPIKRGDVTGSSFAFKVAKDGDEWVEEDGIIIRYVHQVARLFDVSPVTYPAYANTQAAQRSLAHWQQAKDEQIHLRALKQKACRERFLSLVNQY